LDIKDPAPLHHGAKITGSYPSLAIKKFRYILEKLKRGFKGETSPLKGSLFRINKHFK
jgi:pyruvate formate-lyase activating enzyme-like uncharacterized protein